MTLSGCTAGGSGANVKGRLGGGLKTSSQTARGGMVQVPVSPEINALIDRAAAISIRRGQFYVGVEHLYETLLNEPNQLPEAFVQARGALLRQAGQVVSREQWPAGVMAAVAGEVFYTPRCAALATEATRLAQRISRGSATASHLLMAILADAHASPSRALDQLGANRGELLQELRAATERRSSRPAQTANATRSSSDTAARTQRASASSEEPSRGNALEELTRDLTLLAHQGKIQKAIGRKKEIFEVLEICARKGKNNVILVGEAGVGKTRIAEGLAYYSARPTSPGGILEGARILELNLAALMAGTQYRGAFEERMLKLLDELRSSSKNILFIDEIHLIMGAGATEGGGVDAANLLKPALARGEIRCIGATTFQEYRKFIEKDPAIERRFQMVRVEPLSESATVKVLRHLQPSLERHHQVHIGTAAIHSAITLTERYLPNRQLPDKAIDVLDQACARHRLRAIAARHGSAPPDSDTSDALAPKVTPHDVRKVVSRMAGVPIEAITAEDRLRLGGLERRLSRRIIGQSEAIARTVAAVKKARAGLADPNRPDAVLMFLGPSGVGKTQLAKALAELLFGASNHLITFDMSEFVEPHSVARLIGAPPGYVGHGEEGLLTGAVRATPFSILLFDEIEKAHRNVFDILLPVLDEGRIKDSNGREVSFKHCIIIFTSNLGSQSLLHSRASERLSNVMEELRRHFRPEFLNRIDEIIPFYPLVPEDIRSVLRLAIRELGQRLSEKGFGIRLYQGAYELLASEGYNQDFGARELRRVVERRVINPISSLILEGRFQPGDVIEVLMHDGRLDFRPGKARPKAEEPVHELD